MRLDLARTYGGGPAYWLDPELDVNVIETALDLLIWDKKRKADHE